MFTERHALQERLEKINKDEIAMITEYQKQRNAIFERLRELDKSYFNKLPKLGDLAALEIRNDSRVEKDIRKNIIVNRLKMNPAGLSSEELRSIVKKETGLDIINMTSFMRSIMKNNPYVRKPQRGFYRYEKT